MPSFILIHPTVWPQYTNVTDRTDRQDRYKLKCTSVSVGLFTKKRIRTEVNATTNSNHETTINWQKCNDTSTSELGKAQSKLHNSQNITDNTD